MVVELWAKPYGIKQRCYWECVEEQLGNLGKPLGTPWEHDENKRKKLDPS
jgi:hypothetical protein